MLRFQPEYKTALWGGTRFGNEFGRQVSQETIGESWELVEFGDSHSTCVSPEGFSGRSLGDLWRQGVLGGRASGDFPFLLKWLDTSMRLSVQVHPNATLCQNIGRGRPKTEAWYVSRVDAGGKIYVGTYPGLDAETLRLAIDRESVAKWMYEKKPRPGDMYLIEAGTLHCAGAGLLLLEVQEVSDTTFRLYDWGRTGPDGKQRELHIDEGLVAIDYNRFDLPKPERQSVRGPTFTMCPMGLGERSEAEDLRVFVAAQGPVDLLTGKGVESLGWGDVVVAEVEDGTVAVQSGTCVYISEAESVSDPKE